jgi:DNA-binding XRE family transcriptional regulator
VDAAEFARGRRSLAKSQTQLARLLGVSPKAVQSFEQGWRPIPVHVERQLIFLLSLKRVPTRTLKPCWEQKACGQDTREKCVVWEFRAGNLCWFINGTNCEGRSQESWQEKMQVCRQCEVFRSLVPGLLEGDRLANEPGAAGRR